MDAPLSAFEQLPISLNHTLPDIILSCTEGHTLREVPFIHLSELHEYDHLQLMESDFGTASEFLRFSESSRSLVLDEAALR